MDLDPFDEYADEQIWKALECVQLKDFVQGLDQKLLQKFDASENIRLILKAQDFNPFSTILVNHSIMNKVLVSVSSSAWHELYSDKLKL